jgi:sulfur carrier protein
MKLHVNGDPYESPCASLTVTALVEELELRGPVAVEVNRTIVPRARHGLHELREGDVVEIVQFVGGG